MTKSGERVPQVLLIGYVLLFIWAAINPYDRADWWAENIQIVLLVLALVILYVWREVVVDCLRIDGVPSLFTIGGHYAAYGGNAQAGADFLGSQGDIGDAQKDMLMDTLGGITSVILYLVLRGRTGAERVEGMRQA